MSTIYTEGYGNIAEFYTQSASMQSADVTKSIDDLGAYAMMQVMQYAIPTAALHLNDRFELFRYLKKNLLVGVDVPGQFLSEKGAYVIKGLVGGDWFDAEQKCGTGSFPFQGNFCILITSNSRLQVRLDGDTGERSAQLVDDERCERLALDVLGDD